MNGPFDFSHLVVERFFVCIIIMWDLSHVYRSMMTRSHQNFCFHKIIIFTTKARLKIIL